jgi:hypothetical protein
VVWIFAAIESKKNEVGAGDGVFDLVLDMSFKFIVWVFEAGSIDEDVLVVDFTNDIIASSTSFARNDSGRLVDEAIKEAGFASIGLADDCDNW